MTLRLAFSRGPVSIFLTPLQRAHNGVEMAGTRKSYDKGLLLEKVVAHYHRREGVTVETRVQLAPPSGGAKREFDIIIRGKLSHYDVVIPIECKCVCSATGAPQISEFAGKLLHVGLPTTGAVFVSTGRYTRGARDCAAKLGIRLVEAHGIDVARLKLVEIDAFRLAMFHICSYEGVRLFNIGRRELVPHPQQGDFFEHCELFFAPLWRWWTASDWWKHLGSYVHPLVLIDSLSGNPSDVFGDADLMAIDFKVHGWLEVQLGTFTDFALVDASSGDGLGPREHPKFRTKSIVHSGSFGSTEELKELMSFSEHRLVQGVDARVIMATPVKCPRIYVPTPAGDLLFPPSERGLQLHARAMERYLAGHDAQHLGLGRFVIDGPVVYMNFEEPSESFLSLIMLEHNKLAQEVQTLGADHYDSPSRETIVEVLASAGGYSVDEIAMEDIEPGVRVVPSPWA